jgi:hypothetical protein
MIDNTTVPLVTIYRCSANTISIQTHVYILPKFLVVAQKPEGSLSSNLGQTGYFASEAINITLKHSVQIPAS